MIKLTASLTGNRYSQHGEEHMIKIALEEILRRRKVVGWLVEFGASRGFDNSNLIRFAEEDFRLLMIEADSKRFASLEANVANLSNVKAVCDRVGFSKDDNLAVILSRHNVHAEEVSVVSIDIDSDDAAVFENLYCRPDLVIVEFNPTFSSDARFRNPPGRQIGNSARELLCVANEVGMFPVGMTDTNLLFMNAAYRDKFQEIDVLEEIKNLNLVRFAWGYDGTIIRHSIKGTDLTAEIMHNGWNQTILIQPLPKYLRRFTNPALNARLIYFFVANLLTSPVRVAKFFASSVSRLFTK